MLRRLADRAFEHPLVYRMLQAPFQERKLAPFLRRLNRQATMRVLDVGCGPGTNAAHFRDVQYTGVDINPDYIANAQRRFPGRFLVGDVTDPAVLPAEQFDCVLLNSLMHHLDDDAVGGLLGRLGRFLAPGGSIHILDLVLPPQWGAARTLAHIDRGRFARPIAQWKALFERAMHVDVFEQYPLGIPGIPLWQMVYCAGRSQ
ncbi:MAG: class I SAM-dependent methyltransferase [Gemmatimonadota bacterium]